ncbi:MAG: guanylate kinase [Burkholderiales bacterium]|jgi:guanylate kinase|nr:guanylate kinase [Burkholderiales bacterium]
MTGALFIVSAPSGGGKTSLVRALLASEPDVRLSVSHTTRPPRPGEENGRDYHFISADQFERMARAGEFLESAEIYGNRYGTSRTWISRELERGQDVLLEIDWQGAQQVRKLAQGAVSVFILPPSLEALEQRLKGRSQDQPDAIARRLAAAREEISHLREFDYVIINKDFNRAALELASIIRAERLRLPRQLARNADLINGMQ